MMISPFFSTAHARCRRKRSHGRGLVLVDVAEAFPSPEAFVVVVEF